MFLRVIVAISRGMNGGTNDLGARVTEEVSRLDSRGRVPGGTFRGLWHLTDD